MGVDFSGWPFNSAIIEKLNENIQKKYLSFDSTLKVCCKFESLPKKMYLEEMEFVELISDLKLQRSSLIIIRYWSSVSICLNQG